MFPQRKLQRSLADTVRIPCITPLYHEFKAIISLPFLQLILAFLVSFSSLGSLHADSIIKDNQYSVGAAVYDYDVFSEYLEEKTLLLEYILKSPNGVYMDIGTGGDSVLRLLNGLPKESGTTLIAADVRKRVLADLLNNHPEIKTYLNAKDGVKLELQQIDASNMRLLKDDQLSGIGASSLLHEVYSYTPEKSALEQFFIEASRVLKKEGVLIYRDPKWVDNPDLECVMVIKEDAMKYFSSIFLSRFLDRKYSRVRDYKGDCIKPKVFDDSKIELHIHLKNRKDPQTFVFSDFLKLPNRVIDYSRDFSITAPHGLISEIERHYVLYLKDVLITSLIQRPLVKGEDLLLSDVHPKARPTFEAFLDSNDVEVVDGVVPSLSFPTLLKERNRLKSAVEDGLFLEIVKPHEIDSYIEFLYANGISHNVLYKIDADTLWIDAKTFALLFQDGDDDFLMYAKPNKWAPIKTYQWLRREGEEHYYYLSMDNLITHAGQLTEYYLRSTNKNGYMLAPNNVKNVSEAPRDLYCDILADSIDVFDVYGHKQESVCSKLIIHFSLQKKANAFKVYKELIEKNPGTFVKLEEWVNNTDNKKRKFRL